MLFSASVADRDHWVIVHLRNTSWATLESLKWVQTWRDRDRTAALDAEVVVDYNGQYFSQSNEIQGGLETPQKRKNEKVFGASLDKIGGYLHVYNQVSRKSKRRIKEELETGSSMRLRERESEREREREQCGYVLLTLGSVSASPFIVFRKVNAALQLQRDNLPVKTAAHPEEKFPFLWPI